uniref:Regulator of G protein signaling 7 n=1 Tax=Homo sapiens TaxID=9606 RepID=A0A8I5KXV8_HUMAN
MAQGNNYGQTSNGVADESPNMLVYRKTPYFWPSNCWEPENTDYAWMCKYN